MPLSIAEHVDESIGIDPFDRFGDAGVKLARERGLRNVRFARADGMALPFAAGTFDLVLSHAVIEHVADALVYLQECRRVMAADGRLYLSTAPYLSFAGAHLPRLLVPVPLHWISAERSPSARSAGSRGMRRGRSRNRRTRTPSSAMPGAASSSTTTCSRRSASSACVRSSTRPAFVSSTST